MWTYTHSISKDGISALAAIYNAGQPDEWSLALSVDLRKETDLAPLAEKVKAMHAEHLADAAKPDPYAATLQAFGAALNGDK